MVDYSSVGLTLEGDHRDSWPVIDKKLFMPIFNRIAADGKAGGRALSRIIDESFRPRDLLERDVFLEGFVTEAIRQNNLEALNLIEKRFLDENNMRLARFVAMRVTDITRADRGVAVADIKNWLATRSADNRYAEMMIVMSAMHLAHLHLVHEEEPDRISRFRPPAEIRQDMLDLCAFLSPKKFDAKAIMNAYSNSKSDMRFTDALEKGQKDYSWTPTIKLLYELEKEFAAHLNKNGNPPAPV